MKKVEREDYIFEKKSLLVLLFLYYLNNVDFDEVTLRSFGFHFDPSCNFKTIVTSKKGNIHKYVIHIFLLTNEVDFAQLDVMGNVNIARMKNLSEVKFFEPKASLNIYFTDSDFYATGFIEGHHIQYILHGKSTIVFKNNLLMNMNDDKQIANPNSSASSFIQWLLKFYTYNLHTDIVMGAGINVDYGAKNWNDMITDLNAVFYQGNTNAVEQIKHYVGKELFTAGQVLKTSGFDTYSSLNNELYLFKEAKSFNDPDSTLYKCVDYLQKHPGTSVITYNYDTNLEYLLKKRDLRYTTIYDDNSFVTKDSITDIYHVHGLLPYDKYDQPKYTDSLIFNESEYYYLYNNPYSWNIAKQLHDFKFNTCIFIGISLNDPDMKRLLELASNYMKFNFIFIKKEKEYSDDIFSDITNYFFAYDLITIWVDEYEDIGKWLEVL